MYSYIAQTIQRAIMLKCLPKFKVTFLTTSGFVSVNILNLLKNYFYKHLINKPIHPSKLTKEIKNLRVGITLASRLIVSIDGS